MRERGERETELTKKLPPPDGRDERPVAWCRYCRGEIYRGEDYYRVEGRAVCTGCLERLAADYFCLCRIEGGI